jgi:flagellar basal-body rod modification protein FlgD
MEINGFTPTSAAVPRAAAPAADAGALASDFDTFLRMLTVQIRNQDPLNPQSATDFAVQLATFSTVEQQVRTNRLLEDLAGQFAAAGLAQFAAWVGKEARAAVPARFDGAPVALAPSAAPGADAAELVVRDATGREVERLPVPPDARSLLWTGRNADGAPYLAGLYSFELVSFRAGEPIASTTVETWARIDEAQVEGGRTLLVLAGGVTVPAEAVKGLRAPP